MEITMMYMPVYNPDCEKCHGSGHYHKSSTPDPRFAALDAFSSSCHTCDCNKTYVPPEYAECAHCKGTGKVVTKAGYVRPEQPYRGKCELY